MRSLVAFVLLAAGQAAVAVKSNCPIYGPLFPMPRHMKDHPKTRAAAKELDELFLKRVEAVNASYSFVFQAYSVNEGVFWSQKYTAPKLKTMNTTGVRTVDENTCHRVGSITKLFTVLAFLKEVGDTVWNDPIAKYIPEIRAAATAAKGKSKIYNPAWDEITVGSLFSFQSGLMRDYSILGELSQEIPGNWQSVVASSGFPPLAPEEIPPCGKAKTCDRKQFLAGVTKQPPFYAPYQSAMYNNLGFVLLSYVAEAITGKPFMQMVEDSVIKPLNLKYTFIAPPNDSYGVIPGDRLETLWAKDFGNEAPTGNIATSAGDISTLGQEIMKSTLLNPSMTRRWLKPVSFLPDPAGAVGMPWGIRQIPLKHDYQYATSFNKAGRVGAYASLMAILPDVEMGWSAMASGEMPETMTGNMATNVSEKFLSVWLEVAREEAQANYGGRYEAKGLNSTITIRTDASMPGIGVYDWYSNGTDMTMWAVTFGWPNPTAEDLAKLKPSVRLYPTMLEDELPDGGKKVAFRAVFENLDGNQVVNSYVTDCTSWIYSNAIYGSKPLDLFVFTFDAAGKVVSVENEALRATMYKVA